MASPVVNPGYVGTFVAGDVFFLIAFVSGKIRPERLRIQTFGTDDLLRRAYGDNHSVNWIPCRTDFASRVLSVLLQLCAILMTAKVFSSRRPIRSAALRRDAAQNDTGFICTDPYHFEGRRMPSLLPAG